MSGALDSALLLRDLTPANRAKFYKHCPEPDCLAKPGEWCEGKRGTICSRRGEVA